MKEIILNRVGLTKIPQPPYARGGDIFMATEGNQDMAPNSQPTNPEHAEKAPQAPKLGAEKPISAERQEAARKAWEKSNRGRVVSVEERRTQEMLAKKGLPPVAGAADRLNITDYTDSVLQDIVRVLNAEVDSVGVGRPLDPRFINTQLERVGNLVDTRRVNSQEGVRLQAQLNEWMREALQARGDEEETVLGGEINRIRGLPAGSNQRKEAIANLLRQMSPQRNTLPSEAINLSMDFDETFESLVNRIVSLPLDKETSDYMLGLNAGMNLEAMSDAITQAVDSTTDAHERDRLRILKERLTLAQESFSLTHQMNKLIVTGEIEGFIRTAENITPTQLNYLQRLRGVSAAMRAYEETYDRYLAENGWIYPFLSRRLHDEVYRRLAEQNEGGSFGPEKLEEWELRRAYNIGRKLYNNTFRSAEKIATGKVPRGIAEAEKAKIVQAIEEAIGRGDVNEEAQLRMELAEAEKRDKQRFSSFPLESAARIMNPIQLLIYRFQIAEKGGGMVFLEKAKKYYREFLRHHENKLGINKITTLGGVSVEEMEIGGVFGVSGLYSSWRAENFMLSQMKIDVGGQETTVREWFANHVYELEQVNNAFKAAKKNQGLKHDAQLRLAQVLQPLIDNTHVGLGVLLKQQPFGGELGYEARRLLWEKIAENNLPLMINYLSGLQFEGEAGANTSNLAFKNIVSNDSAHWTEAALNSLRKKILLDQERNIKEANGVDVSSVPTQGFDTDEVRLIFKLIDAGKKLAPHLADIAFPYMPFMNDAPFEIFDYTIAGDEFYRRRAAGDIPSYFKGSNAFVTIVDNASGISMEDVQKQFHELERGIESPQGREDAQRRTFPLFEAWLDWVITKPGQRHVLYKAIQQTRLKPTSQAQEYSIKAMSLDEEQAREAIDLAVQSQSLNGELADELKKKKNLKLFGILWALFRDMFTTVIPSVFVYAVGKESLRSDQR